MISRPDVHFVRNDHRQAAGHSLDHGDAEVLGVGGKGKKIGVAKGGELVVADQHAGEGGAVTDAGRGQHGLDLRLEGFIVGAGDHQMDVVALPGDLAIGFGEDVQALLEVDPAKEQEDGLVPGFRKALAKHAARRQRAVVADIEPERHDEAWTIETYSGRPAFALRTSCSGRRRRRLNRWF